MHCYLHFADEETKVQQDKITSQGGRARRCWSQNKKKKKCLKVLDSWLCQLMLNKETNEQTN